MTIPDAVRNAACGSDVHIDAVECTVGRDIHIGDRVTIEAERLVLGDHARIASDVVVRADVFELGHRSCVDTRCSIGTMSAARSRYIRLGDNTLLSHDCKLLVPAAAIGDYTAIHNHTLLNGRKPLVIGHNCWIGQHCVINSEDDLFIGNHVGIGACSSVYTHGYFGDLLEGSQVFKVAPVRLEDDAWILGSYNIISPGVVVGEKALVLTGSNVTKDVGPNRTVGGAPARDLTDRLTPYRQVGLDEKYDKLREFVQEFLDVTFPGGYAADGDAYRVSAAPEPFQILFVADLAAAQLPAERPLIVFAKAVADFDVGDGVTVVDLSTRSYRKTRTEPEIRLLGFLKSYRARFVPADQPRVEVPSEYVDR